MAEKLLFLIDSYPALGGVETVTSRLAGWLSARFDVMVLARGGRPADIPVGTAVSVGSAVSLGTAVSVGTAVGPRKTASEKNTVAATSAAVRCLWLPDAVDFNSPRNRQYICDFIRENDVRYIINQGVVSQVWQDFAGDARHKVICVLHACPAWQTVCLRQGDWRQQCRATHSLKPCLRHLYYRIPLVSQVHVRRERKRQIAASAAYVVLAEAYRQELEATLYGGRVQEKLRAIPNPLAAEARLSAREKTVVYAGRFTRADKRLDRLLRIWKRVQDAHPDWHLQLVGEGPEQARLCRQAARLGLERVDFRPAVSDGSQYAQASIACLTSSYEGLNMFLLEAQQAGIPVMAFDCNGGMALAVQDGRSGVLVKPFDEKAYARALSALMDDSARRDEMAAKAREYVRRFDMESVGNEWLRLFDNLV